MIIDLPDGLYRVDQTTPDFCAGFVLKNQEIEMCAPILRRRIEYWATVAEPIQQDWDMGPHRPQRWSSDHCREIWPDLCWCCETNQGFMLGSAGGNGPRIYICKFCDAESRRY